MIVKVYNGFVNLDNAEHFEFNFGNPSKLIVRSIKGEIVLSTCKKLDINHFKEFEENLQEEFYVKEIHFIKALEEGKQYFDLTQED